jgi:hypothetical protein
MNACAYTQNETLTTLCQKKAHEKRLHRRMDMRSPDRISGIARNAT